jgi:hypothetical protein
VAGAEPDPGRLTNRYQQGRPNQKPCGLACGTPYQTLPRVSISCAHGANAIGVFGLVQVPLPFPTNQPFWLCLHSHVVLPIITGRGVKYTHDIKHTVLHSNRGPPGIRLISQASDQKKVAVGDGGAKHRSVDPPTDIPQCSRSPCRTRIHTVAEPAVLTPRPPRTTATAQILCAKQTNLVKIS